LVFSSLIARYLVRLDWQFFSGAVEIFSGEGRSALPLPREVSPYLTFTLYTVTVCAYNVLNDSVARTRSTETDKILDKIGGRFRVVVDVLST